MNELLLQGKVDLKTVKNGVKLYKMTIPKSWDFPKTTFLDSLNFLPIALAGIPEALDLRDESGRPILPKQWFPLKFNHPDNYGVRLPKLPAVDFYYYKNLLRKKRNEFLKWHDEHQNEPFDLGAKLIEYCTNDVEILRYALFEYRKIFKDLTKVQVRVKDKDGQFKKNPDGSYVTEEQSDDIFLHCSTIASTCIRMFRIRFLQQNTIPITPEGGYEKNDGQSKIARKFLR